MDEKINLISDGCWLFADSTLSAADFLQCFWGKQPLFLPQALQHINAPSVDSLNKDTLFKLLDDLSPECRLILNAEKLADYQVLHSPLTTKSIGHYTQDKSWTLLIQAIDQWLPELTNFAHYFSFLPLWRFDDLMVSIGNAGSSVGPHSDNYDVFLLQVSGEKQWHLGATLDKPQPSPHAELSLLPDFTTQQTLTCSAGDILYIPPKVPHFGTAITDNSITLSVGFRSPSLHESLGKLSDVLLYSNNQHMPFYNDSGRLLEPPSAEISPQSLAFFQQLIQQAGDNTELLIKTLGCLVTEPRYPELTEIDEYGEEDKAPIDVMENPLQRNPHSRFAFFIQDKSLLLFIDGEQTTHPLSLIILIRYLCEHTFYESRILKSYLINTDAKALFDNLLKEHKIIVRENSESHA